MPLTSARRTRNMAQSGFNEIARAVKIDTRRPTTSKKSPDPAKSRMLIQGCFLKAAWAVRIFATIGGNGSPSKTQWSWQRLRHGLGWDWQFLDEEHTPPPSPGRFPHLLPEQL